MVSAKAAHQEITIGKIPAQMVNRGMMIKRGVVMAPTMYDQTPEQYMMRMKGDRPRIINGL